MCLRLVCWRVVHMSCLETWWQCLWQWSCLAGEQELFAGAVSNPCLMPMHAPHELCDGAT
jgi:hypothetical protein